MIRRTFFQLLSGLFLPSPPAEATASPAPALLGVTPPPATPDPDPEWLREWRQIPRLEVCAEDIPDHNDPHQRALAAEILPCIRAGSPFVFRYLGGTAPGAARQVLPVQLFFMDYFDYYQYRVDDPGEIPETADTPIYLLAWCQSRHAPRTFRLDRMQSVLPPPHRTVSHHIAS